MMAARDVAAVATLLRRRCVLVAPGYDATPALAARLEAALDESGAVVAIASPFARGGRLRDRSWLARMVTAWSNGFLSLAAHGDVATVVGTIRVCEPEALERILASAPGIDLDAEIVLQARRLHLGIVEIPMELERTGAAHRYSTRNIAAAAARLWARVRCGLFYRPSLWLALPGLLPGLLPLVVAFLLLIHATPGQLALWTIVTLIVQYGSLALFSWQAGSFAFKRLFRRDARPRTS
jgi:hypothetical protein